MNLEAVNTLQELQHWLLTNQLSSKSLYIIGFFAVSALLIVLATKKLKVPIVVGYVFVGILFSGSVVKYFPFLSNLQTEWYTLIIENFSYVADVALAFIAFTIGSELSIKILKSLGKKILFIVLLESFGAFTLVTLGLLALGKPFYLALILGAIASATAPAATVMVLQEYNAEGSLTSTLLAVVGIDDAVALTIFSFAEPISLIRAQGTGSLSFTNAFLHPLLEVVGSIVCGLAIGYLSVKLMVNFEDKTKKVLTLTATVLGASSLAVLFELSPLIINMAVGFAYRNFVKKNLGIAEDLETLTIPIYAFFFMLAGTKIRITAVTSTTFLITSLVYTLTRATGKIGGASLGARLGQAEEKVKKYIGLGLLSQIGVAVALAYTVQRDFAAMPKVGLLVFNILLFTTAITEVVGPLAVKYAITKAGEAKSGELSRDRG
ncbi:Kef-type K+ transport system, membrane component [Halobacteroides halobius DSM 5150]|uniref:Kef-type K+ transport system, membrane component n=1 Tax=Halobacteroides halobius (strain ATCC 35273 / DSM 5150 / MD-1) TaxID=748449 RepID=L0K635_HALHC|nr:cation:proton antiporter [Halobacteroides halobius]AGB40732.1 Kef-type K+ transport system, membrane component [Halobacteroides halobius DSM 5150]